MDLTLSEVATVLGKSLRQVRYLLKTGKIVATRDGRQWKVDSSHLPLTEEQRRALAQRMGAAQAAFAQGIEPVAKATEGAKRPYSVTDLQAFQAGLTLLRDLHRLLGEEDALCRPLRAALSLLARGCHCFQPGEKSHRFGAARDLAAAVVAELLLREGEHAAACTALALRLEGELIPKIAGLVAATERSSRRSRFDSFGNLAGRSGNRR